MSQRGWVLFLLGCAGILCLEGPDTVRWTLAQGASVVLAAEGAPVEAAPATRTSFLSPLETSARALPAFVEDLDPEASPAAPLAGPAPTRLTEPSSAVTASASRPFQLVGGCMPVPKRGTRPATGAQRTALP